MSNGKYYDYYKTSKTLRDEVFAEFDTEISAKRDQILEDMKKETGCVAWRERGGLGGKDIICDLAFPADHPITNEPHIKIETRSEFEGKDVVSVRGMGNRKAGKEFNAIIARYNALLESYPKFGDWILKKFDIMRTGFGGVGSKGYDTSLLSSFGGDTSDGQCLVFGIPNSESGERHGSVTIPESFEKITYGQFIDLCDDDEAA
jgi:hypothetical protein